MGRRTSTLILMAMGCVLTSGVTWGQEFGRGYAPARRPLSPYLNLLRNDDEAPLPNYQALVRPQLNQEVFNRGAELAINRNVQQITTLRQSPLAQPRNPLQVRNPRIRPTGIVGQFQYFSHYFPVPQPQ